MLQHAAVAARALHRARGQSRVCHGLSCRGRGVSRRVAGGGWHSRGGRWLGSCRSRRRRGRCSSGRSRGGRWGRRARRALGVGVDQAAHATHRHHVAFFRFQRDDASSFCRQFQRRLVGIHFCNGLVLFDVVAVGHEPCCDFDFRDALPRAGDFHFKDGHGSGSLLR